MGTSAGVLRRGSGAAGSDGGRGSRRRQPVGDVLREALRTQLDGGGALPRRHPRHRGCVARGLPAALPDRRGGRRGLRDEFLQLGERNLGGAEPAPAHRHSAYPMALRRIRAHRFHLGPSRPGRIGGRRAGFGDAVPSTAGGRPARCAGSRHPPARRRRTRRTPPTIGPDPTRAARPPDSARRRGRLGGAPPPGPGSGVPRHGVVAQPVRRRQAGPAPGGSVAVAGRAARSARRPSQPGRCRLLKGQPTACDNHPRWPARSVGAQADSCRRHRPHGGRGGGPRR